MSYSSQEHSFLLSYLSRILNALWVLHIKFCYISFFSLSLWCLLVVQVPIQAFFLQPTSSYYFSLHWCAHFQILCTQHVAIFSHPTFALPVALLFSQWGISSLRRGSVGLHDMPLLWHMQSPDVKHFFQLYYQGCLGGSVG